MKKYIVIICFILCLPIALFSEGGSLITDPQVRQQVETDFTQRMEALWDGRGHEYSMFVDEVEDAGEREALQFLLAYTPLCDIADMRPEFFLDQARWAFRARDHFSWGRSVPDDIFLHFVLPHRINNENLDIARDVFYYELKNRIAGMSMYDAALEVNHWCHEKVEYRATDSRTSAPLALVRTSWGRCGEESAFTATALRAVGIPARQVYTPRWVHTDSNHAWVEVWIDGQWRYLGACEPEPELDMAWFTTPATRAMMMHTTVFGKYAGPEEINLSTDYYTVINLLGTYAPTKKISVTVQDIGGRTVQDATVKFKVYNYSELYPLVTTSTGTDGRTSITTGYGDVFVWANSGDSYGYAKMGAGKNEAVIMLNRVAGSEYAEDFVMNVPVAQPFAGVESSKVAENRRRLAQEDSIRNAYMSGFGEKFNRYMLLDLQRDGLADKYDGLVSFLVGEYGLDGDRLTNLLERAQGNYDDIGSFMLYHQRDPYLLPFLESLSEKDLRDTPKQYLDEHLEPFTEPAYEVPEELGVSKILSPRIDMEIIRPWRYKIRSEIFRNNHAPGMITPLSLVEYVRNTVRVDDGQNYVACTITPYGVYKTAVADKRSRNVFFVALCRTAGIPAHIGKATGKPQFWKDGVWHDALLDGEESAAAVPAMGKVSFDSDPGNPVEPVYRTHYTIAKYEDGDFRTLDLAGELSGTGYPSTVEVPSGYYRLMAGSRANDGSVSLHTEYFNLTEGGTRDIAVALPRLEDKLFVEGILDMNTVVFLPDGTKTTLKEQANDKGLVLIFVDPATEPTRHILQEMPAYRERLEEWGGGVLFVESGDLSGVTFNRSIFGELPAQTVWMTDEGRSLLNEAAASLRMQFGNEFPLTLYLNTSGGILFSHKGYRLGLVESVWKTLTAEAGGN